MSALLARGIAAVAICTLASLPTAFATTVTNLHNFTGAGDGGNPAGTQVLMNGALYGTTETGGASGFGTIYRVSPANGTLRTLYSFANNDGHAPLGGLVEKNGLIYGITNTGGTYNLGTVFSFSPTTGLLNTLYSFQANDNGNNDGAYPTGSIVLNAGVIYGTTSYGGQNNLGTVFAVATSGGYDNILHNFAYSDDDGGNPLGGVSYEGGTLYGTTSTGGAWDVGTIFSINLAAGNNFVTLRVFTGGNGNGIAVDGAAPQSAPLFVHGALYGTTSAGGANGNGTIYKMSLATGFVTKITSFSFYTNGSTPIGPVVGKNGLIYGTTSAGGANQGGTVFVYSPTAGTITDGFDFNYASGYGPQSGLVIADGNLFGATAAGGANYPYFGTLIEVTP